MQRQTDNTDIDSLLKRAAEFAAFSVTNVTCRLDDDRTAPRKVFYNCLEQMHELEVHFLFPNLLISQRKLLVRLLNIRRALATRLGRMVVRPSARGAKREDALLTQLKREFTELEGRAERLLEDLNLTPCQKQILQSEFLGLPDEG